MEVTEAMIEAGKRELWANHDWTVTDQDGRVTRAYEAMRALEPRASSDGVVERLERHRYKLPEGFYSGEDHGCNTDSAESLVMSILDSGPQGTTVMQQLTVNGFTIVETEALDAAIAALQSQPSSNEARLREALEIVAGGDVDVSDTAIIVGNGASTVMRQIHAALANEGNG